jgi:hypothetical protein
MQAYMLAIWCTRSKQEGKILVVVRALANAGLACDPCGGPLEVTLQRERERIVVC